MEWIFAMHVCAGCMCLPSTLVHLGILAWMESLQISDHLGEGASLQRGNDFGGKHNRGVGKLRGLGPLLPTPHR